MHHGQFPRHSQHCALTRRVRQLRRGTADQGNHTRRVNHTGLLLTIASEAKNGMLAPVPHALSVNSERQVPDGLGGIDGIGVVTMHNAGIVEDNVQATPGVEGLHCGGHRGFFGDVDDTGLEAAWGGGTEVFEFGEGFCESRGGDVG